ncbi:peroxisomal biogenesis factor 11 (PEX11) domain-containing protein [Sarocladium implicatum]|nr:peroxisomal biogenesis factor 11 (PEX11) domain-containing protein [Sarocladium implicatum]
MAGLFEQFVAFGCDSGMLAFLPSEPRSVSHRVSAGLERILRGLQSLVQIFAAWPLLFTYINAALSLKDLGSLTIIAELLQGRIGLARRIMRTFRFLESFSAGWTLSQQAGKGADVWLDVLSKTTLGMYGMLETVTLPDVMGVPGLEYFGAQRSAELNRQAQIYWGIALFFSVLSGMVKIRKVYEEQSGPVKAPSEKGGKNGKKSKGASDDEARAVQASAKVRQIVWKATAESMDMIIPAAVVGWIDMDRGIVASVMLLTSLLTGKTVWDRCSKDLDAKKV